MNKNVISKLIIFILLEIVLSILLFVVLIFSYSYIEANFYIFTDFSILKYGSGFGTFWMLLYLGTNALFTVTIILVFVEIVLFDIRMMAKLALKTLESTTEREYPKFIEFFKSLSLITLFKKCRINSRKRAIIFYLVLIVMIFGVKFVSKTILNAQENELYRVYENINLYHDTLIDDLTSELESEDIYNVIIHSSVGNVHLYTLSESTEAKLVYLYDTSEQKNSLSYQIDTEQNTITISFNMDVTSYTPYVDDLLPQVELYLPETLNLGDIDIQISTSGNLAMDYVNATSLNLNLTNVNANISLKNDTIENYDISASYSTIRVETKSLINFTLTAVQTEATLVLGDITGEAEINASFESNIYFYRTQVSSLVVNSSYSYIDLRDVYATNLNIISLHDSFTYINGNSSDQPTHSSVSFTGGDIKIKGIEYDFESTD